jgi:hypothetical protein
MTEVCSSNFKACPLQTNKPLQSSLLSTKWRNIIFYLTKCQNSKAYKMAVSQKHLRIATAPSTVLRHQTAEDLCVVFLIQCPFHNARNSAIIRAISGLFLTLAKPSDVSLSLSHTHTHTHTVHFSILLYESLWVQNTISTYARLSTVTPLRAYECKYTAITEYFTVHMFRCSVKKKVNYVSDNTTKER